MGQLWALISCFLLRVAVATAQTAQAQISDRPLPQWLTGIIAVSGFLFLVFVTFLVKKAWCTDPNRRKHADDSASEGGNELVTSNGNVYDTSLDLVRSKEDSNAYNNLVLDSNEDKVTSM